MRRVGLMLFFVSAGLVLFSGTTAAQASSSWRDTPIVLQSEAQILRSIESSASCSGTMTLVSGLSDTSERTACVYGQATGLRVARYHDEQNIIRYAVSFASELKYYEVREMCVDAEYCLFSQAQNTAVIQESRGVGSYASRVVKNFSQHLTKHKQGTSVYFTLNDSDGFYLSSSSAQPYETRATAISTNGDWGVFEVSGWGLIRLDMKTGEYRWVATLDNESGLSSEDSRNLTISNNGEVIALTGWYQGLVLYVVDDICGYQGARPQNVEWCLRREVDRNLLPGFIFGYSPRFTDDGKKISLIVDGDSGPKRMFFALYSNDFIGNPKYIAFGDSFVSGEGELDDSFYLPATNIATNRCHVSSRSYPYLLSGYWDILVTNHACSGSRIPDVRAKSERVLADRSEFPSVLSLGIGGNDVDLVGKLKSCLGPGTCEWALQGNRAGTINEMKRLLPSLISLITDLQRNSSAAMFLVGYPLIINPSDNASCSLVVNSLLNKDERQYMDETIRYVNRILEAAAQFTDIAYVNIQNAFQGERLCDDSEVSMNGVRMGDDIAPVPFLGDFKVVGSESFHPTPWGHRRVASMIRDKLQNFWISPSCEGCSSDTSTSPYWTNGASLVQQMMTRFSLEFIRAIDIKAGQKIPIDFPAETFSPESRVKLEIHSTPVELTTLSAQTDGSLKGEIIIPNNLGGYHTVHALSESVSGENIDIYQGVYIEPAQATSSAISSVSNNQAPREGLSVGAATIQYPTTPEILGIAIPNTLRKNTIEQNKKYSIDFPIYILVSAIVILIIITLLYKRKV